MFELIKNLAEKNGTNITALCKQITGSSGNLPTWKKGNIRPEHLSEIADMFNVSTDYLLGKTDDPKPISQINDEVDECLDILHKRGDIRMLFSVAKDATKEDIEMAADIIEKLVKKHRGDIE